MKQERRLTRAALHLVAASCLLAPALAGHASPVESAAPAASSLDEASSADASPNRSPMLLELFTSQGCSSCPPADRLLMELAEREDVIALSFHVDYWNYIGWTDPFSSPEWSERQRNYATAFRSRRVYTPQLVVNGRWEGVGADPREVRRLLARATEAGSLASIDCSVQRNGKTVSVTVAATSEIGKGNPELWLAITESGFQTPVGRGENARKTLRNDNVVRSLERVAATRQSNGDLTANVDLPVDPSWKQNELRVVAFLQDSATRHVLAAVSKTASE